MAESTLEMVKRGHLRCQVGQPTPGFYNLKLMVRGSGDVSICRAVAAAIFGDPQKVEFQSVSSTVRFTALANGGAICCPEPLLGRFPEHSLVELHCSELL